MQRQRGASRMTVRSNALLDAFLRKQVDVGFGDELGWFDPQLLHEFPGFAHARLRRLVLGKHDLELQEVPQTFDSIEVNARSAGQEQGPAFLHPACLSVRQSERLAQCFRR